MSKQKISFGAALKERLRKLAVGLKRNPHYIPLLVAVAGFLWYSLQLTTISNTTAGINGANMGLCGFVTMLFSMLGIVCLGYSFPHRKPVNKWMLTLSFLLFACVLYADYKYLNITRTWVYKELSFGTASTIVNDLSLFESRQVSRMQTKAQVQSLLNVHMILVAAGFVMTALLPVYSKLLRKINTSVKVQENENMTRIDIAGEDA